MYQWYKHPLDTRATKHGEIGVDGKEYKGGEFLPFYIPRPEMPQVDEIYYPELFLFIEAQHVSLKLEKFDPHALHAHQRVNWDKVRTMDAETLAKPILTSEDGYVLDGNHRWTAHVLNKTEVNAYVIGLEFEKAIELLFSFPKTYAYGDGNFHPVTA